MTSENKSKLDYLKKPSKSLIREELVNYKLISDLKLEAAARQRYFKIYKPEIDFEGCDFIIEDDTDLSRKIQIKTRIGNKKQWTIHRSILLPSRSHQNDYNLDATMCPTYSGAFILVTISEKNGNLYFDYSYTDVDILYLIALGFIKSKKQSQDKAIEIIALFQEPLTSRNHKVTITDGLLIKVKDLESLVYFLGIFQEVDFELNAWKLIQLTNNPKQYFGHNDFNLKMINEQIRGRLFVVDRILKEHTIGF